MTTAKPPLSPATVQRRLADAREAVCLAERQYEEAKKLYQQTTRELRERCPHTKKTLCMGTPYDPTYYTCDICGKDDV